MEKNYKITEKQLVFLENYLKRKYSGITDETRIELTDHLVSDFEATTVNGNLSQYLADELGFIRKFVFDSANRHQKKYGKETWNQFFDFFKEVKLLPITFFVFVTFYVLSENLNDKWLWASLMIVQSLIMLVSVFFGMINKKKLRKLDEVKYLGAEIWLPFLMIQIPQGLEFQDYIIANNYFFTFYASFTAIYVLAAFIVLRVQRKYILDKYKHLLN